MELDELEVGQGGARGLREQETVARRRRCGFVVRAQSAA